MSLVCNKCFKNECECKDIKKVEIDEGILDAVKLLNEKGYITEYCCEGHTKDYICEIYILFDKIYLFNDVPNMFYLNHKNTYRIYPRTKISTPNLNVNEINKLRLENQLILLRKTLFKWVKSLPNLYAFEDSSQSRFELYKDKGDMYVSNRSDCKYDEVIEFE